MVTELKYDEKYDALRIAYNPSNLVLKAVCITLLDVLIDLGYTVKGIERTDESLSEIENVAALTNSNSSISILIVSNCVDKVRLQSCNSDMQVEMTFYYVAAPTFPSDLHQGVIRYLEYNQVQKQ